MQKLIVEQIAKSIAVKQEILDNDILISQIGNAALKIINAYKEGKKVIIAGNGGSAADAQHIAGEFVSRFYFDRPGLAAIAVTTDTSILTAIGNDYGFDRLFARQVEALGNNGDVFIGISTSGNSHNILEALSCCREKGIFTIGFTGKSGGKMADKCDLCIMVPSSETPRIQESHILLGHIICALVEEELFGHMKP